MDGLVGLDCEVMYDAAQKKNFAPDVQDYHHVYDDAVRAARKAGCGFAA